ncbi:hypothetical protein Pla111_04440 [Botrimarina hoheduenensis]|uniref:Uncharacterized protein n=1 Tax=Botrimarina hoheduenensis TaxID=2528000 RepID=A0A5C5WF08_9BACT|nr:hypothetical protein Pla111_04440 [Botrimarina hoheduenensis]
MPFGGVGSGAEYVAEQINHGRFSSATGSTPAWCFRRRHSKSRSLRVAPGPANGPHIGSALVCLAQRGLPIRQRLERGRGELVVEGERPAGISGA